jgi:hypothetical protein
MADAFPSDDPIAQWVMNLSIALGDLRIVAHYSTREEQPAAERMYFFRVFASHLREVVKLLTIDYKRRANVREFVAALPPEGQEARAEAERMLEACPFKYRPDVLLWKDLKRVRDDTFHYASDPASQERLRAVMADVSDEEGIYIYDHDRWLRADYADLVAGNRMQPFPDDVWLPASTEMLEAIVALNAQVVLFINHVEATYFSGLPAGVVTRERTHDS